MQYLLGGFGLGCAIGLGGAIAVELLKPGFRRPEEVESYLGLPVIASIPPFDSGTVGIGIGSTGSRALLAGPRTDVGIPDRAASLYGYGRKWMGAGSGTESATLRGLSQKFHLIAKWEPDSVIAEQYRVAATRLLLMTAEKKNVVTLVRFHIFIPANAGIQQVFWLPDQVRHDDTTSGQLVIVRADQTHSLSLR